MCHGRSEQFEVDGICCDAVLLARHARRLHATEADVAPEDPPPARVLHAMFTRPEHALGVASVRRTAMESTAQAGPNAGACALDALDSARQLDHVVARATEAYGALDTAR